MAIAIAVLAHAAVATALLSRPPSPAVGGDGMAVTLLGFAAGGTATAKAAAPPSGETVSAANIQRMAAPTPASRSAVPSAVSTRVRESQTQQSDPTENVSSDAMPAEEAEHAEQSSSPTPRRRPDALPAASKAAASAPHQNTAQTGRVTGSTAASASPPGPSAPATPAAGSTAVRSAYIAELRAWLARNKQYPERALARRQQGTATLYFVLDRNGYVLDSRLEKSSGHRLLDWEATALLQRASPMPRMPAALSGGTFAVIVPIEFALR